MTDRELDALRAVHRPHRGPAASVTAAPRPPRMRAALSPKRLLIPGVLAVVVIVWALSGSDSGPVVPTAGLSRAEVTVNTGVIHTATIGSVPARSVAAAVDALPSSSGSGSASCGMDQGYTDTVVFQGDDTATAVIDLGGCLEVTVSRGGEQWVLDDSSGAAVGAVHRALTVPTT